MTPISLLHLCAAAVLTTGSANIYANLITNGSSESPVVAPGLSSVRPDGWSGYGSFVGGLVHGSGVSQGSFLYPNPYQGDQFVDIGTGELTAPFTVTTPGDYSLKWFDNSLITGWNGSYAVEITDSSLAVVLSKAYSYSYLVQSPPWRELSLDLPALPAGNYTVKFGPGTTHTYIDDVSVNLKQLTVATPDSGSTAFLLGIALLGLLPLVKSVGPKHPHANRHFADKIL